MHGKRLDLYGPIHKALRSFIAEVLGAIGRLDADDDVERAGALSQLRSLLDLMDHHADVEDEFIHAAMQSRRPGSAEPRGDEHRRQRVVLRDLRRLADDVERAPGAGRAALAQRLYRTLALVVAENLAHMDEEETLHNAVLWAEFSDDELAAIHDRIVASTEPRQMAEVIRWMAPSLTPAERAALFGSLRSKAPADVFHRLLEVARPHLAQRDWNKLVFSISAAPRAA
jgi:hypothetical protein